MRSLVPRTCKDRYTRRTHASAHRGQGYTTITCDSHDSLGLDEETAIDSEPSGDGISRPASANAIGLGGVEARLCRLSPTISRIPRLEDRSNRREILPHVEKVLRVVSDAAKLAGVVCDTLHVEHDLIYQAIIEAAEARKCDLS